MLQLPADWVYGNPGPLPPEAVVEFFDLIRTIAKQGDEWAIYEHFKRAFGEMGRSSDPSWALTDLRASMDEAAENAPSFIASLWKGLQDLASRSPTFPLPDENVLNSVFQKRGVPYLIKPPHLLPSHAIESPPVNLPDVGIDDRAKQLVKSSLEQADRFLAEGKPRQAVQEIIWLLETVTTAFEGREVMGGTIEGKYFNKIVRDLVHKSDGGLFAQAGLWMEKLHGYLSSPTGGGVRHGANLGQGNSLTLNEAVLICNLTRSYIGFLLASLGENGTR